MSKRSIQADLARMAREAAAKKEAAKKEESSKEGGDRGGMRATGGTEEVAKSVGASGATPADGELAAKRAAIAEMVRAAREAQEARVAQEALEAAAQKASSIQGGDEAGKSIKDMSPEEQMKMLFTDTKIDAGKKKKGEKKEGEKVLDNRKQENFGLTKCIKP